ncbi:MAG: hypothetical protein WBF42_07275 [Terracidiphilus sp.]
MAKAAKKTAKERKGKSATSAGQLDVVFDGTWVILPEVNAARRITGVKIYSPSCGHPQGVTFVATLAPNPWPNQDAFYQLDNHGYTLPIQRSNSKRAGMHVSWIDPVINHIVTAPRLMGENWDLQVSIPIGPDAWVSSDTVTPKTTDSYGNTVPCFAGDDAPKAKVSSLQTLSFEGLKSVALFGAPARVQALLPSPWNGKGSLIFEDEIPYIPSITHERAAIDAMADLAGLDLVLNYPLPARHIPSKGPIQAMLRTTSSCGHSLIVIPA